MSNAMSHTKPAILDELLARYRPGFSLEQPFYTSPEIFEHDIERIYMRHWIFAGHTSLIPHSGDYFVYNLAQESIVIIRGQEGQVNALFNVCRHRGSRICLEDSGKVKKLVCPYHAWVYETDGTLLAARHMPEDFDKSQFNLHRCHVRVSQGLIFICLAQEPPDFDLVLRDMEWYFEPHELENAKICHRSTHQVKANWKLVAENFWECYHCAHTHPEFCSVMTYAQAAESGRGQEKQDAFVAEWETYAKSLGHRTGRLNPANGAIHSCARHPIRPGYLTQSEDGQPVAPLMGRFKQYDGGVTSTQMFPMNWFVACNDHAMLSRFTPLAPQVTEIELTWLVHADAREGVDYDAERVAWLWTKTAVEDYTICENNQAGVNSRRYQPGRYSKPEQEVDKLIQWYLQQLA